MLINLEEDTKKKKCLGRSKEFRLGFAACTTKASILCRLEFTILIKSIPKKLEPKWDKSYLLVKNYTNFKNH